MTADRGAGLQDGGSAVAARVAAIFSEVFGRPGLAPSDDFFALGGDSLMAETLMAAIEREFGVALPTSLLVESSTPASLSTRLSGDYRGRRKFDGCLSAIRAAGSGMPLFWIHGMTGYFEVAEDLGKDVLGDRPVYGFRALGLKRDEVPPNTVPKIAEHYLRMLKEAAPSGPYLLGGQCPTGFIALEMARQLKEQGEAVPGLIMIDPYPPIPWMLQTGTRLMQERLRLQDLLAAQMKRMPAGGYLTQAARDQFVFEMMRLVTGLYTPRPYDGPVLLVCTEYSAPHLLSQTTGLPAILSQLETVRIGKEHLDAFRQDLPAVSKAVGAFLSRVA